MLLPLLTADNAATTRRLPRALVAMVTLRATIMPRRGGGAVNYTPLFSCPVPLMFRLL